MGVCTHSEEPDAGPFSPLLSAATVSECKRFLLLAYLEDSCGGVAWEEAGRSGEGPRWWIGGSELLVSDRRLKDGVPNVCANEGKD